ncbi:ABC transporter permease [Leucobacter aridicollis]|uniref:ABC transporter permease n=1 Tax=Leucobacter aridicollis TaxID=283878 RepID=UPI002106CA6A|nr:ABC transporter permease [Leucobacter aridicollis]UTX53777.1 FtsX-like permease family protein [Leucobacter aridicollis]
MAALSVLVFSGLEGGWRGIQTQLDAMSDSARMPNAWITGLQLTPRDAAQVEALSGIERATLVSEVTVEREDDGHTDILALSTSDHDTLNAPYVLAGTVDLKADELALDTAYAEANRIQVGDKVTLMHGSGAFTLRVAGLILQPDKIAYTGAGLVAPDPEKHGYGLVTASVLNKLKSSGPSTSSILVRGDASVVRTEAAETLGSKHATILDRSSNPTVSTAYERVDQIRSLSYLFSSLFVAVSLLSIFTSIRRLTDTQQSEVAVLKALGFTNSAVGAYFTAVGMVAVSVGIVVGLSFAPFLSTYVLGTQQSSFALPSWTPSYTFASGLLPFLLIAVCALGSWTATRPVRRSSPATGMRPGPIRTNEKATKTSNARWRTLSFGSRWALRDAAENPVRLGMGVVATAGGMMLLIAGFGMPDTLNNQVQESFSEQYRYSTRLAVSPLAPPEVRAEIAATAGPGQWIQQVPIQFPRGERAEGVLTVLGKGNLVQVSDTAGTPLSASGVRSLVTQPLNEHLNAKAGSDVEIALPDGSTTNVHLDGVAAVSEPLGILITEEFWVSSGGTFTPTAYLTRNPPPDAIAVTDGVTAMLNFSEQRSNAQSLVDSLSSVFTLIKVFAILLTVIVLYNLGTLSFTERVRDYATLRVLGFTLREIRALASRENVLVTLAGWLIGVPAGWWFLSTYVELFSTDRATYFPYISVTSLVIASAITILSALTATLLLTRRVKRIDMTEALKGVE